MTYGDIPRQGRINHCGGCTMGGGPAARGPRSTPKFLLRCFDVWTFSVGLNNLTTTTKKVVNFFGEKVHPRENLGYEYKKRAPPYVGMGPPIG